MQEKYSCKLINFSSFQLLIFFNYILFGIILLHDFAVGVRWCQLVVPHLKKLIPPKIYLCQGTVRDC